MSVTISTRDNADIIDITISTEPFTGTTKKAFWGWMSTGEMLTEAQIIVLQGNGSFNPGATIVADFRGGNAAAMFLYMAERETEPAKTTWYANSLDQGIIGPGLVFSAIGVVNGWRVYRSGQKTQFSSVTEFRIS